MKVAQIQFSPWDKTYYFSLNNLDVHVNDQVVVKTDIGEEIGKVIGLTEVNEEEFYKKSKADDEKEKREIKPILRFVTERDAEGLPTKKDKQDALEYAKSMKEKYNLEMKFLDVHFSFDRSRVTFAFIADGRIDFRNLVKDLTRHFGRSIRLQQIGIRDEARICGDCGHCGRPLCCRGHLKNLDSITSEMSEMQQCSHRGSDRISGICGRLMCCLAYEQAGYEELFKKMPPLGKKVDVDGKKGEVIGHRTLKQCVMVKFPGEKGEGYTIAEVDLNRNKDKK
ncbi:stage 0 sporulation protein [Candidatus Parcubacteria bacterium]|nr:stage 0 sporulation protein [Patescibacteria group bacterium]MBU4309285.1 stage 0 sporulation protein [Patescibacteria group bacterium]MBU4431995.1 stage 0 sporulation protein [Patescibacteria group bacterium]MBU4577646.1 stage 0 sporulation protein [Patescibacteria group bacterium]MCG2697332.1 stage 0 sporulation protein [Candidatus Parcubacteria bacterium]